MDQLLKNSRDQCNPKTLCNIANNKSIIDQLRVQIDEASQIIICLKHEHDDANLNKLNMMLSDIEQMKNEMCYTINKII